MNKSLSEWFIVSAGVILATTGIAKVGSQFSNWRFLTVVDPIMGLKFGQLMLAVGVLEIVIALVCFVCKRQTLTLSVVAWISTIFGVYRVGLWWMNWKSPCGCLGKLADVLHMSPASVDRLMKIVLAYLLVGSYGLLLREWQQGRNRAEPESSEPIRGEPQV